MGVVDGWGRQEQAAAPTAGESRRPSLGCQGQEALLPAGSPCTHPLTTHPHVPPHSPAPPTRSSLLPWNLTALMTGHQRLNSLSQLCSVDLGTMTMWGPVMPRNSRR